MRSEPLVVSIASNPPIKCRLCAVRLNASSATDDFTRQICGDCRQHPAAKRLGPVPVSTRSASSTARDFTPAEASLIQKRHRHLPAADLLALLNERLEADLGPDAARYTSEQLRTEVDRVAGGAGGRIAADDWSSLRRLLASARRDGLLERITPRMIDDFAVVFTLSPAQLVRLKDVVLTAKEDA